MRIKLECLTLSGNITKAGHQRQVKFRRKQSGQKMGQGCQRMKTRGNKRWGEAVRGRRLRGMKSSEDEGGTRKGDRSH